MRFRCACLILQWEPIVGMMHSEGPMLQTGNIETHTVGADDTAFAEDAVQMGTALQTYKSNMFA
jgi:hypothetical protein